MKKPECRSRGKDKHKEPAQKSLLLGRIGGLYGSVPNSHQSLEAEKYPVGIPYPPCAGSEMTRSWISPEATNTSKLAAPIPICLYNGRKINHEPIDESQGSSAFPKNSLSVFESIGLAMIGCAGNARMSAKKVQEDENCRNAVTELTRRD